MMIRRFRGDLFVATCLAACGLIGCGGSVGPEPVAATGKVTFQGQPVTEGTVLFEESATGHASSGPLSAEGAYAIEVPPGTYRISVTPPLVALPGGPNSPPSETYKEVKNIPERVRSGESSGLTATITPDSVQHDFDLKP